ncbi:MAG TPA: hypothetical protein VFX89_09665 [Gammaproteobacteria bacterium]|nr:hypothetical protein [Gammaproteobacteria bacterium]
MNFVTRLAMLAAFTIAATAGAEESSSNDDRVRLARAELANAQAADSLTLDDYAGRYVTRGGAEFFVVRDGDSLTIVTPASWIIEESPLVADGDGELVAPKIAARVSFAIDAGRVTGLTAYPQGAAPIAAVKAPLRRGIVTIQDVDAQEALAFKSRRGFVTIEDVYDAPSVAAAR